MEDKNRIQDISLSFVCPQNWDDMTICGNGRFCAVCKKTVYDFTNKSQVEYDAIRQNSEGQLCGRFTKSQVAPSVNWTKIAMMSALSLGATVGHAQKSDTLSVASNQRQAAHDAGIIFGMVVEPNAEFIGGTKAMFQFLAENLIWPPVGDACIEGTVYVGFEVETNG